MFAFILSTVQLTFQLDSEAVRDKLPSGVRNTFDSSLSLSVKHAASAAVALVITSTASIARAAYKQTHAAVQRLPIIKNIASVVEDVADRGISSFTAEYGSRTDEVFLHDTVPFEQRRVIERPWKAVTTHAMHCHRAMQRWAIDVAEAYTSFTVSGVKAWLSVSDTNSSVRPLLAPVQGGLARAKAVYFVLHASLVDTQLYGAFYSGLTSSLGYTCATQAVEAVTAVAGWMAPLVCHRVSQLSEPYLQSIQNHFRPTIPEAYIPSLSTSTVIQLFLDSSSLLLDWSQLALIQILDNMLHSLIMCVYFMMWRVYLASCGQLVSGTKWIQSAAGQVSSQLIASTRAALNGVQSGAIRVYEACQEMLFFVWFVWAFAFDSWMVLVSGTCSAQLALERTEVLIQLDTA